MSKIAVIAKITAQPGKRADVVAGMASMMDHVETEPGTLKYILTEDQADADSAYQDRAVNCTECTSDKTCKEAEPCWASCPAMPAVRM